LSVVGVKSIDDLVGRTVNASVAHFTTMSSGLAYFEKYPSSALPYLRKAFDERSDEEPVIIALLLSAEETDDWDTQRTVLQKLQQRPAQLSKFQNPLTYNAMGLAAINQAVTDARYSDFARARFDDGLRVREADDSYANWYLHFNRWRLFLLTGDG